MQDVLALLEYYLQLLCKHKAIREYIEKPSNGFEELNRVLAIMKKK